MSRQLKPNEWIYYFNLYEKNLHQFQSKYELLKQKPFKNNCLLKGKSPHFGR